MGHGRVRPEHLLLALLAQGGVAVAPADYLVDIAGLKEAIHRCLVDEPKKPHGMGLLLDPSPELEGLLIEVWQKTKAVQRHQVALSDLASGLLDETSKFSLAAKLPAKGLKVKDLERGLIDHIPCRTSRASEGAYRILRTYSLSLTDMARSGLLEPIVGRHREIRRVMQILCRREKNNPLLVGPAGVGKSSIVHALAQLIANDDVPAALQGCEIFALDPGSLQSGAEFRGMLEERVKAVIAEIRGGKGKAILLVDDVAAVVKRGPGATDLSSLLRPALAAGDFRLIGIASPEDYRAHVEKEPTLEHCFQVVRVAEPSLDETLSILRGVKSKYEAHHDLQITDDALKSAAALSHRFVPDRSLPDKAIDLLDEAAAKVRIEWDAMPQDVDSARRRLTEIEVEMGALTGANGRNELEIAHFASEAGRMRTALALADSLRDAQAMLAHRIIAARQRLRWAEMLLTLSGAAGWTPDSKVEVEARVARDRRSLNQDLEELKGLHETRRLFKVDIDEEDVAEVVASWTGIPLNKLMEDERAKLLNMENALHQRVVGQEAAIVAVSNAVRLARAGMKDPNRPVGSFLFLGPTGVGKTELCRALAEFLFDDESAMVRIDMSEYMDKHTVSRLVGAPPGYVGYDDSGQLTETVRRRPYSVILFDEIEKAHPDIFNVLLQIMEDGRLTDGHGRTVDFKNTIVTLTSNIGGHLYREHLAGNEEGLHERLLEQLRANFRPEFLNRLDAIVFFDLLTRDQIQKIVEIQVRIVNRRLAGGGIRLEVEEAASRYLAAEGYDVLQGARPLKRLIQQKVLEPLALKVLQGDLKAGGTVLISLRGKDDLHLARIPAALNGNGHVLEANGPSHLLAEPGKEPARPAD